MKPAPEFVKKKKFGVSRSSLKFRHRMFIRYVVSGMPKSEVVERLEITKETYEHWLKDERIVGLIEEKTQYNLNLDAKKRKKRFEFLSSEVYSELIAKIAEGSLKKTNTKNLVNYLALLNKEIRTDTPGENVKKVDHNVKHQHLVLMEQISSRYMSSNSALFENRDKIVDIVLPKQIEEHKEEETVNDIRQNGKEAEQVVRIRNDGNKEERGDDRKQPKVGKDDRGEKQHSGKGRVKSSATPGSKDSNS